MRASGTVGWLTLGALSLGALQLVAATPALACSSILEEPFQVDPDQAAIDTTPPTPFTRVSATAWRVAGTHCNGDRCSSTSCGDRAGINVTFTAPVDDLSPSGRLGYRVVWLRGAMPRGFELASVQPLHAGEELTLSVDFDSAPIMNGDFALVAIDRAGNESALSQPVHVEFSGCTRFFDDEESCQEASSCTVTRAPGVGSAVPGLALGLWGIFTLAWCSYRRRSAWRRARVAVQ